MVSVIMKCYKKLEVPVRKPANYSLVTKAKQKLLLDTATAFLFAKWTSTHIRIEHLREKKEREANYLQTKCLIDSLSAQDLNAICPVSQQTLLHSTIKNNDKVLFAYLLERGASPFIACQGLTILENVILNRRSDWLKDVKFWLTLTDELAESLIDMPNLLTPPTTPLITAASMADRNTFNWLLEQGAQLKRSQLILKQHTQKIQCQFNDCIPNLKKKTKGSLKVKLKLKNKKETREKKSSIKKKETKTKEKEEEQIQIPEPMEEECNQTLFDLPQTLFDLPAELDVNCVPDEKYFDSLLETL
jgi:hypothetical protein